MKNSIRIKLFISIVSILLITTFIGFIINSQLYKKYYISSQKKSVIESAKYIEKILKENIENTSDLIEQEAENNGYTIFFVSLKDFQKRGKKPPLNRPLDKNFKNQIDNLLSPKNTASKYSINIYYNEHYNSNFLKLVYRLQANNFLIIETPTEIINTSARFNLRFYLIISTITIVLGGIFSYFFSKKFTEPILKLNDQAKSIAKLEFNKSFIQNRSDEIGTLGKNMNYLSEKLENTIQELNLDLKEKEKLENLRKRFIASVSHEFKTPIALIRGYAEGLQYDIHTNKEEYTRIIIEETERMDSLVKELLEISDLESGQTELTFETFDLSSLIDEILYKYNRTFQQKDITVTVQKGDIVTVTADYKKIEEVFTNYLNNAINHLTNENILKISLITSEQRVRCEVYNSGNNIPEEALEHLWNSFYKIDESRNRASNSTGLGLYIVKKIMELHQGNYGVINENNGVTFYFELKKD